MNTKRTLSLAAAAVLLATSGVAANAATCPSGNLVTNCGFESGDFTGWTLTGNDVDAGTLGNLYGVEGADPFTGATHSGGSQAFFADQLADSTTLSQSIATTAGTVYTVSFWMAEATLGPGTNHDSLAASFGGTAMTPLTGVTDQGYTEYTFTGVGSAGSTTLSFTFGNDLGEFVIDDIGVTGPAPAVPEPSTLAMFGLGALALAARRKVFGKR